MRRREIFSAAAVALLTVAPLPCLTAQTSGSMSLRRAVEAYDALSYADAIVLSRRALKEKLTAAERARTYELLGFAYASLDSARQATEAFKQVILLNPDRELDLGRISPKITSMFALALGQVLVIRRFEVDTSEFVAGTASLPIRFTVTRTARVRTRIVGGGSEALVDSSLGEGVTRLSWNGLMTHNAPPASGNYRVIVEASAGRDSYAASVPIRIVAGAVDTADHLTSLPGYQLLPETMVPPRNWRPFGVAFLAAAAIAGGSLALENSQLGPGARREITTIGLGTMVVGLLASAKRPAPVPATANIRYNTLVREQLARRNSEIAVENVQRRQQVKLRVMPEPRRAIAARAEGAQ
ncbi:MAG: hypothetical protein ABR543_16530 [Gemmatimonadaceae bacterium]